MLLGIVSTKCFGLCFNLYFSIGGHGVDTYMRLLRLMFFLLVVAPTALQILVLPFPARVFLEGFWGVFLVKHTNKKKILTSNHK